MYHDNLFSLKDESPEGIKAGWTARNEDLLIDLLYEMGISLGYYWRNSGQSSGVILTRGCSDVTDAETTVIRRGLTKIFLGEKAFPIIAAVLSTPPQPTAVTQAQAQIQPAEKDNVS